MGGNLADFANGIALDSKGCAYITGGISSGNFPIIDGVYNETYGGGEFDYNSFVFKLSFGEYSPPITETTSTTLLRSSIYVAFPTITILSSVIVVLIVILVFQKRKSQE